MACLGNPDPVGMKVYCPTGKVTFDDATTKEAPPEHPNATMDLPAQRYGRGDRGSALS